LKQGNMADFQKQVQRQMAAAFVDMAMKTPIEDLKEMLASEMKDWTKYAGNPKRSDRAKYAKMVSQAQALQGIADTDQVKFRRGYAVLKSAEAGGLGTEAALFGASASAQQEEEQLAWDKHGLKNVLRRKLSQLVAVAPKVDFAAQTVQQGSQIKFVNPAYEAKRSLWKAMYRAGKAPTDALAEFAQGWLKEL